jgi:hypothetical protein
MAILKPRLIVRRVICVVGSLVVVVVGIAIAGGVRTGWRAANAGLECQKEFDPLPYQNNGYIEFSIEKQELIEPVFDGKYFINLADEYGRGPLELKVTTTGARSYGNSQSVAHLNWDNTAQVLWMMGGANPMGYISQSGSHRDFPLDSARFDFTLKTDPWVNLPVFRFNNHVTGFTMPCEAAKVLRGTDGSYQISFELRRDALTRLTAVLLVGAAALFALAITLFVDRKSLGTAVASYFFSLWSIRGIFGLGAEGFPTKLDISVLALCVLILLLLALRLLWAIWSPKAEEPQGC